MTQDLAQSECLSLCCMVGWMGNGQIAQQVDGWVHVCMGARMCVGGQRDGWLRGWMGGGWVDRWITS